MTIAPPLPKRWKQALLGEALLRIESGVSPKALDRPAIDGELGVLKVSAVTWGQFRPHENKALPPNFDATGCPRVGRGDLLLSRANTAELLASPVLVPRDHSYLLLSDKTLRLVPNGDVADASYLYHALLTAPLRRYFASHATGTSGSMRNVSQETIRAAPVPLPSLSEQKRIAVILDQADGLRRKRQQALALTDQFLRSTFLDLFGDPVTNPKRWPEARLDVIADIQSGVTKGRKLNGQQTVSVPYMRVANVQDGHLVLDEVKEIEVMENEVDKFRLKAGDVLLTEGGDFDKLGRGTVWRGEIDPCIHQNHIFRVRPRESKVLPEFLSAILASSRGKRYFLSAAKQTTGIASINKTQLSGFPAFLPPVALQNKFESVVSGHHKVLDRLSERFDLVENLFNSLVQRAFRGEL